MSFIVGFWTANSNSSARIWPNTSLVMSSQLPRSVSSCSHIYYRADDIHFVTSNHLPFKKVRTSECKALLSHLQPAMLTCLAFTSSNWSLGWKIAPGKSNFHWPVLELQLLLFWDGVFFDWEEDLFPMPKNQHHYVGFRSHPSTHPPFSTCRSVLNLCLWNVFFSSGLIFSIPALSVLSRRPAIKEVYKWIINLYKITGGGGLLSSLSFL